MSETFIQIFKKKTEPKSFVEPLILNNFFDDQYDYYDLGGAESPLYFTIPTNVVYMSGITNVTSASQEIINLQPDTYYDFTIKGYASGGTLDIWFKSSEAYDRTTGDGVYSVLLSGNLELDTTITIKTSQFPSGFIDGIVFSPNPDSDQFYSKISGWELTKNTTLNNLPQEDHFGYTDSYYLDVVDDLPVPLNYSIDAIENPSSKDSNWSKSITLSSSKKNQKALGNLHDDNSTFEVYNVNNKAKCIIWSDGIPVFNGWFQLLNVSRVDYGEGGKQIEYEARVYSDTTSIINDLSKKDLSELDLSKYDHRLEVYNVSASWDGLFKTLSGNFGVQQDAFVYPLLYTENTEHYTISNDFLPAVYARKLIDESFIQNGYSVSFSSGITQVLDHLILPHIGKRPLIPEEYLTDFDFKVSGDTYLAMDFYSPWDDDDTPAWSNDWGTIENQIGVVRYVDTNTDGYNDDLYFHLDENYYEVPQTGQYQFDLRLPYTVRYFSDETQTLFSSADVDDTTLFCYVTVEKADGTYQLLQSQNHPIQGGEVGQISFGWNDIQDDTIAMSFQENLQVGDKVFVRMRYKDTSQFQLTDIEGGGNVYGGAQIKVNIQKDGYFQMAPVNFVVTEGSIVNMSSFLPKMKQGELLKELQKMFNWLYLIDPAKPNHIHLVSRREYYQNGEVLDWTSKLDNNSPVTTEFLTDVVAQNLVFSYKEASDTDELNSLYSASQGGEIWGQKEVIFENSFVQDQERIGTKSFVPTPFTKNPFGHPVPSISTSANTKGNRILFYAGRKTGNDLSINYYSYESQVYLTATTNSVPLNIHLNDYTTSTIDINYGVIKEHFAGDNLTLTENNLYNMYWKDYVRTVQNGRRLTARFYLDQKDIQALESDLSKKIWLYNKYWIISKVKDYFPNKLSTTEVELVSWFEATNPDFTATYSSVPSGFDFPVNPNTGGDVPTRPTGTGGVGNGGVAPNVINNGNGNVYDALTDVTVIFNGNNNGSSEPVKLGAILAGSNERLVQNHQVILNKDYQIIDGQLQQRYSFVGGEREALYSSSNRAFHINQDVPYFTIGGKQEDGFAIAFEGSNPENLDLNAGVYERKGDFIAGGKSEIQAMPYDLRYPPNNQ